MTLVVGKDDLITLEANNCRFGAAAARRMWLPRLRSRFSTWTYPVAGITSRVGQWQTNEIVEGVDDLLAYKTNAMQYFRVVDGVLRSGST